MNGLRVWLALHDALVSDPDFWETEDMFTLWTHTSSPSVTEYPRVWSDRDHSVSLNWRTAPPSAGSQVRILSLVRAARGTICSPDLSPLGEALFTYDPHCAALDAKAARDGKIRVAYFGKR